MKHERNGRVINYYCTDTGSRQGAYLPNQVMKSFRLKRNKEHTSHTKFLFIRKCHWLIDCPQNFTNASINLLLSMLFIYEMVCQLSMSSSNITAWWALIYLLKRRTQIHHMIMKSSNIVYTYLVYLLHKRDLHWYLTLKKE